VILLAEHDEPTLAAKKKRQPGASSWATSTPKNRVWGFENTPSGRPSVEPQLTQENATGSVQYTYQIASGRAEWLSRDPIGSAAMVLSLSANGRPYSLKKVPDLNAETLVGPNLYSYVWNDPIDLHDPEGLCGLSPCVKGCIEDAGGDWALAALGFSSTTAGTLPKVYGAGALGAGRVTTGLSYLNAGYNALGVTGRAARVLGRVSNPVADAVTVGAAGYLLGLLIGCEATCAGQQ
jgi:hypothetical protein